MIFFLLAKPLIYIGLNYTCKVRLTKLTDKLIETCIIGVEKLNA